MVYTEKHFFEAIRQRSDEHQKAFDYAYKEKLYSQMGSIIRQELDSFIRVDYYNGLSIIGKQEVINRFFASEKAFPKDSVLVRRMQWGWLKYIYNTGCAFIHLSQYHSSESTEPQLSFTDDERKEIVEGVNWWQKDYLKTDFKLNIDFSFNDLVEASPGIFNKLRVNLLGSLK